MRAGLVYLRPEQVVFIRAVGPYGTSSVIAWKLMREWIERNNLRNAVSQGFGLALDHSNSVSKHTRRYDACIELPIATTIPRDDCLPFQTLPSGAFARVRHVGSYARVRSSIVAIRDRWLSEQPSLLCDPTRPLLTIYLDDPDTVDQDRQRCDVCVPVRTHHDDDAKRTTTVPSHAH